MGLSLIYHPKPLPKDCPHHWHPMGFRSISGDKLMHCRSCESVEFLSTIPEGASFECDWSRGPIENYDPRKHDTQEA